MTAAGAEPTPNLVKKLPRRLQSMDEVGLIHGVALLGAGPDGMVRIHLGESPVSVSARTWQEVRSTHLARLYVVYACRWLPMLVDCRIRITQGELARRFGVNRKTVAREIGALVDAGWLRFEDSGSGGRVGLYSDINTSATATIRNLHQVRQQWRPLSKSGEEGSA